MNYKTQRYINPVVLSILITSICARWSYGAIDTDNERISGEEISTYFCSLGLPNSYSARSDLSEYTLLALTSPEFVQHSTETMTEELELVWRLVLSLFESEIEELLGESERERVRDRIDRLRQGFSDGGYLLGPSEMSALESLLEKGDLVYYFEYREGAYRDRGVLVVRNGNVVFRYPIEGGLSYVGVAEMKQEDLGKYYRFEDSFQSFKALLQAHREKQWEEERENLLQRTKTRGNEPIREDQTNDS